MFIFKKNLFQEVFRSELRQELAVLLFFQLLLSFRLQFRSLIWFYCSNCQVTWIIRIS